MVKPNREGEKENKAGILVGMDTNGGQYYRGIGKGSVKKNKGGIKVGWAG